MGTHDRWEKDDGPHQDVNVTHTEMHLEYKTMSGTDIAVLYLERDVDFTGKTMNIIRYHFH